MRRNFLGLIIFLILAYAILISTSNTRLVGTESTTIVVPDNFLTIQEAINNAFEGDTIFVKSGVYYEHVIINKTVSLIGEGYNTTIIDGNWTGHVINIISDNVNVTEFTLQKSGSISYPDLDAGICLNNTADCTVSKNRLVSNSFAGISLLNSQRNTIVGNNVTGAGWGGIHLLDSSNNTISGNILDNNIHVGINGHGSSHHNSIMENIISNSRYGMFYNNANYNNILRNNISNIAVEGIWFQEQVNYNIVAENTLTNYSVGIKLQGPNNNNTVSGNILTDGQCGIRIQNARYTEIYNNTIAHNYGSEWDAGIRLDSAGYSKIHSNLIVDNWRGVLLYTSSPYVSINNNTINDNEFAIRVASGGSNYLSVYDNIVMNNRGYGIGLTGFGGVSNYATITGNLIMNNSDGIALGQYSNYNTILQNNITQNDNGIYIEHSTQNTIRGNNIVDNIQQVFVSNGSVNNWDGGYPIGGNYWSNYNGSDLYNGPEQNLNGSDGIGDSQHQIDENNIDRYPLMQPAVPLLGDLNRDGLVNMDDANQLMLSFGSYPGHPRWNSAADLNHDDNIDIFDGILLATNIRDAT